MSDYEKQLEQEIERLRNELTEAAPWKPRWEKGSAGTIYEYRSDYVIMAAVVEELIHFKPKFYVSTSMAYDLTHFNTAEECRDFIDKEIKGISWKNMLDLHIEKMNVSATKKSIPFNGYNHQIRNRWFRKRKHI